MHFPDAITIDPAMARDLDDAIDATPLPNGGWIADICIADVLKRIIPNSALDQDARENAFSTYAGSKMVHPMLPLQTTLHLSLLPKKVRRMIWVRITLDRDLQCVDIQIQRIQHTTAGRLSYEEADVGLRTRSHPFHDKLRDLNILARGLLKKRNGFWNLDENLATNEEGETHILATEERFDSHLIVQEMMILANEQLAELALRQNRALLFRNHRKKRTSLTPEEQTAYEHNLTTRYQLMGRAYLMLKAEGHYGLKLNAYAHFTSPIRRYADIINWRVLLGQLLPTDMEALAQDLMEKDCAYREARSSQFRKFIILPLVSRIQEKGAVNFHTTPFRHVLEACLIPTNPKPPEDLEKSLAMRLAESSLDPKDFILIFTTGRGLFSEQALHMAWVHVCQDTSAFLQLAGAMQHREIIPGVLKSDMPEKGPRIQALAGQMCAALQLPPVAATA